jgi:hypothetical protein
MSPKCDVIFDLVREGALRRVGDAEGLLRPVSFGSHRGFGFFPAGSSAEWNVDSYIKKVAFLRSPLPKPLAAARRLAVQLRNFLRGEKAKSGGMFDARVVPR